MAGAALPWANTLQPTVNPAVDNHLPETLGLTVGTSKIEVLWLMTSEDDEGNEMEYEQWWPALLESRLDIKDREGRCAYRISYEPNSEAGYPDPESHQASFFGDNELWDVEEEQVFPWRPAGSTWEPSAEYWMILNWANGDDVNHRDLPADPLVPIDKLLELSQRIDRLRGATFASDMQRAAEAVGFDASAQRELAHKCNVLRDALTEEFAAIMDKAAAENEGVVDLTLANEMLEKLKQRMDTANREDP